MHKISGKRKRDTRKPHGGNLRHFAELCGLDQNRILDFSANLNPLGPPDSLRAIINSRISELTHYPDPDCTDFVAAVAYKYGVAPDEVLAGNGSSELIQLLPRALGITRAIIPVPSYSGYTEAAALSGIPIEKIYLDEKNNFQLELNQIEAILHGGEAVFLGNPNNPTGSLIDEKAIRDIAKRKPNTFFVIDEAFMDFINPDRYDSMSFEHLPNVICLLSLTKIFAIPGLRLGAVIATPEIIGSLRSLQPTWSVNTLALAVGTAFVQETNYIAETQQQVATWRTALQSELAEIPGLKVYPGVANYLLLRLERTDIDATILFEKMLIEGISIRVCDNYEGLDSRYFRLAVRNEADNVRLLRALRKVLGIRATKLRKPKTPAIMFQGIASNSGKSLLTAAFCRILLQDGFRVAPFKSQNMSLNSFVTRDGHEMGRAQVVQAQASRLDPDVRMNPILLKPSSDCGSQVILNGKVVGNMQVNEYINFKPTAFEAARQAYDSLARECDAIVLEGAGSPAEVNLKHHDIVNMHMARYAESPVLLIGDIDRGGVFASLVGTMEVLSEWERRQVSGFVINKFRGNPDLLQSALDYTTERTGTLFLGTVPYIQGLNLPEEDSVGFKNGVFDQSSMNPEQVEIAIIDLPHISNFTDFDPFLIEPDVHVTIIRSASELKTPDVLILPGSKNVMADIEYLKDNGFFPRIEALAAQGRCEIVGICGGLQMLGREISDPEGLESFPGNHTTGIALLPITNELVPEKTLIATEAKHQESGIMVKGYEIHHGKMRAEEYRTLLEKPNGELVGVANPTKRVWGTYLHGIFDSDKFRRWYIDQLRIKRGWKPLSAVQACYDLEPALDRLAETVRANLKVKEIYRIMGLK